jgi:hypothetical protein
MVYRALLIGSQTGGLSGVETDVMRMAESLHPFGFETRTCVGNDATRDGIFQSYERLIADSSAEDAALVYYSGHGGIAPNPEYQPFDGNGPARPRFYQFIVPFDMDDSTGDDFRGIIDIELSALLRALTENTRNTTLILDCCHAARMSRDVQMTPKALAHPWIVGVAEHVEDLRSRGLPVDRLAPEGNPDAVRMVACGPQQSAFEYSSSSGQRIGILTESLIVSLEESQGLRISWSSVAERVRRRVLDLAPTQRPELEGPGSRVLFGLETLEETGMLPVEVRGNVTLLHGGRMMGVDVGDEYKIIPQGTSSSDQEEIALANVTQVEGASSVVALNYRPGRSTVPPGARAVPIRKRLHRYLVRIEGTGPMREPLVQAIANSSHVRLLSESIADAADVLAHIEITTDGVTLRDTSGNPLAYPKPLDTGGVHETLGNLNALARAQVLRDLRSGVGPNELRTPLIVEWGRVDQGRPHLLSTAGELLFAGDPVYVRVANQGAEKLYFSIYDVGVSSRIGLVTTSEPSGIEVAPGQDYVLGTETPSGRLVGQPLEWPASVPREGNHTETLMVIVSDIPQDLRALEQSGVRSADIGESELQRVLEQVASGGTREVPSQAATRGDVRYAIAPITFLLDPNPAPVRDTSTFLIDQRPDLSVLYRTARSATPAPKTVAIRLTDLIVHRNRMLFGGELKGDVRVDTVVVTGQSAQAANSTYRMETAHFSGIVDGDRLPFENLLVFYGSVAAFIDLGVWVSKDKKDAPSLTDLFQKELNSGEFKAAALMLAGLAVTAPQAAVVVGALGAGATVCNISSRLLSAALGTGIGLYRTSVLAQEGFGIGRHPSSGTVRSQDFSFGFEILKVD